MSKVIIFEGPDNVFKSTNVKEAFKYFTETLQEPCNILHYIGIKKSGDLGLKMNSEQYKNMFDIIQYHLDKNINLILDRSHLGEMVYSHYRNYNGDYIYDLEIDSDDIKIILLLDNQNNLISREDGDSISLNKDDKINEIINFMTAIEKSKYDSTTIYVDGRRRDEIKNIIIDFIKGE